MPLLLQDQLAVRERVWSNGEKNAKQAHLNSKAAKMGSHQSRRRADKVARSPRWIPRRLCEQGRELGENLRRLVPGIQSSELPELNGFSQASNRTYAWYSEAAVVR